MLNQILWMLPGFIPMIYIIAMDSIKTSSGYYNRYVYNVALRAETLVEEFPKIEWLEEHVMLLFLINLGIVVVLVFLLSDVLKNGEELLKNKLLRFFN